MSREGAEEPRSPFACTTPAGVGVLTRPRQTRVPRLVGFDSRFPVRPHRVHAIPCRARVWSAEVPSHSEDDLGFLIVSDILINCPACGRRVSRMAGQCIGCGHPISQGQTLKDESQSVDEAAPNVEADSFTATDAPPAPTRPSNSRATAIWLVVVVALGIGGWAWYDSGVAFAGTARGAYAFCLDEAVSRSIAPATAETPGLSEIEVLEIPGGRYPRFSIEGYLDSENEFGAMVRTTYVCDVAFGSDSEWIWMQPFQTETASAAGS